MKKIVLILGLVAMSSQAFATLSTVCTGTDKSGRQLRITYYTPDLKNPNIPEVPGAEFYANVMVNQDSGVYALVRGQIYTGHVIDGFGSDFGVAKLQISDGGKTLAGTIGGVRFAINDCAVEQQ